MGEHCGGPLGVDAQPECAAASNSELKRLISVAVVSTMSRMSRPNGEKSDFFRTEIWRALSQHG